MYVNVQEAARIDGGGGWGREGTPREHGATLTMQGFDPWPLSAPSSLAISWSREMDSGTKAPSPALSPSQAHARSHARSFNSFFFHPFHPSFPPAFHCSFPSHASLHHLAHPDIPAPNRSHYFEMCQHLQLSYLRRKRYILCDYIFYVFIFWLITLYSGIFAYIHCHSWFFHFSYHTSDLRNNAIRFHLQHIL